jgi:DNA-binding NtrC family response regulator
MPNMTGLALAEEISTVRPGTPIILCTGFSEAPAEARAKAIGIRKILMKPVELEELGVAIREVFENRSVSVDMGGPAPGLKQQCA